VSILLGTTIRQGIREKEMNGGSIEKITTPQCINLVTRKMKKLSLERREGKKLGAI
jgi:hypothetical protein